MKIREIKSVQEWTADVAKKLHPYSKTLKAVDWYFATAGAATALMPFATLMVLAVSNWR